MGFIVKETFVAFLAEKASEGKSKKYQFILNPTKEEAPAAHDNNKDVLIEVTRYLRKKIEEVQEKKFDDDINRLHGLISNRTSPPSLRGYLRVEVGPGTKLTGMPPHVVRAFEKLFDKKSDFIAEEPHAFESKKSSSKKSDKKAVANNNSYEDYCQRAKASKGKTLIYEEALMILMERFKQTDLKKLTIVVDDLSFIFKIAPILCDFLAKKDVQACLLFGAKNGYALLRGKELLMLYKLGFHIEVMPLSETFQYHGFIFDYFAPTDGKNTSGMEFFPIRYNSFDRGPLLGRWSAQDPGTEKNMERALKTIQSKREKAIKLSEGLPFDLKTIPEKKYCDWLFTRFSNWKLSDIDPSPPLYSTLIKKEGYTNIKFDFEEVDFDKIFYRVTHAVVPKIWQAEQIFNENQEKDGIVTYRPTNLFYNDNLEFYPVNVPFLEFNAKKNRFEIIEGLNRFYFLSLKKQGVKKVNTIVVRGLPDKAFDLIMKYKDREAQLIKNDWDVLPVKLEQEAEESALLYKRHIETVTHEFDISVYIEIAKALINKGILTKDEARNFLGGDRAKYLK